ncbi:hypothetical protein DA2_3512 [Desulfovibrio sp. A2]|nr:hypothetical protein DA2_3512 [Desulfovibrio sp. A2]
MAQATGHVISAGLRAGNGAGTRAGARHAEHRMAALRGGSLVRGPGTGLRGPVGIVLAHGVLTGFPRCPGGNRHSARNRGQTQPPHGVPGNGRAGRPGRWAALSGTVRHCPALHFPARAHPPRGKTAHAPCVPPCPPL